MAINTKEVKDSLNHLVDLVGADIVLDTLAYMMDVNELKEYVDWLYDYFTVYEVIGRD